MTINFDDKTKYNSIAAIRDAKDDQQKDVFTREQKAEYFFDFLVNDTESAREVAKLLIKVKDYKKIKKASLSLVGELELAKQANNLAYRVVNQKYLVDSAIAWLKDLNRLGSSDVPKDKAAREEKIRGYETEISKLQGEQGPREKRIITLRLKKTSLEEERNSLSGLANRWENVVKVLNAENKPSEKIVIGGVEKNLSDATTTVNYNDYDNSLTDTYDSNKGLFKKDSNNNEDPLKVSGAQLVDAVKKANSFLEDIVQQRNLSPKTTLPATFIPSEVAYSNDRQWNCKNNITSGYKEYGYNFLKVLRDVGIEKLKKAVAKSNPRNLSKDTLNKYAEEIVKYIDINEAVTEDIGNAESYLGSQKWVDAEEKFHGSLLKRKLNEFPYVNYPDYSKIFAFMKEVFPVDLDTSKKRVISLKAADYLDKYDDDSFLKPSSGKKGWDNIWIGGFQESPRKALTDAGLPDGSLIKYLNENPGDTKIKQRTKEQIKNDKVNDNWEFKTLTKLWWDCFIPFMNDPDPDSNDYNFSTSDVTYNEYQVLKVLNEIRYCKTMKSILLDLGLLIQEDEFDNYLLEISDMASKGSWINPRDKITKTSSVALVVFGTDGKIDNFFQRVESGELYPGTYDYRNFGPSLSSLVNKSTSRLNALNSEISQTDKQINLLDESNAEDQNKIDDYRSKIDLLKGLGEDEELPTEDKKTRFDELYNKKSNQSNKWYYDEIQRMINLLNLIKGEISASDFDKDFKSKETELKGIEEAVESADKEVYKYWKSVKSGGDKDLTSSETIIEIKKNGESRGITLLKAKEALEKLEAQVLLRKIESGWLETIKDAIEHPDKYEKPTDLPPSDLTDASLNAVFGTSNISGDELKLSKWKELGNNLNQESEIKKLVEKYKPDSTDQAAMGEFKAHLADAKWGGDWGGIKFDGADYWPKLVKSGPEFVIGAIKHFEWEHGKGAYTGKAKDASVTNEMEELNKEEKATELKRKITETWDTKKASHIAQFLYRKAVGKTGADLFKKSVAIEEKKKDKNDDNGGTPKAFWKDYKSLGFWGLWGGLTLLVVGAGCAVVWWDQIKNWWEPTEENPDQDKENE